MNTKDLIKEIKKSILALVQEKYGQRSVEIEKDVDVFLKNSKEKIVRWTLLLKEKKLSIEEFELLLNAQKDLFIIKTLYQLGVSKISLGHLKNNIIGIIINTTIKLII